MWIIEHQQYVNKYLDTSIKLIWNSKAPPKVKAFMCIKKVNTNDLL